MPGEGPEGARPVRPETHPLHEGVTLRLTVPAGADAVPEDALPLVEIPVHLGVTVALRAGRTDGELALTAFCARAPTDRWAPGVEALVLERATGLVRGALALAEASWTPGRLEAAGPVYLQTLAARGDTAAGVAVRVRARHLLGFAGPDREALLCTVACTEPAGPAPARCDELVAGAILAGELVAEPPPGLVARSLLAAAEHPLPAAALAVVTGALAVGMIVARRPRARWG